MGASSSKDSKNSKNSATVYKNVNQSVGEVSKDYDYMASLDHKERRDVSTQKIEMRNKEIKNILKHPKLLDSSQKLSLFKVFDRSTLNQLVLEDAVDLPKAFVLDAAERRDRKFLEHVGDLLPKYISLLLTDYYRMVAAQPGDEYYGQDPKHLLDLIDYLLSLNIDLNSKFATEDGIDIEGTLLYAALWNGLQILYENPMVVYSILEKLLAKGADQRVKFRIKKNEKYPIEELIDFISNSMDCATEKDITFQNPCIILKRLILDAISNQYTELIEHLNAEPFYQKIYNNLKPSQSAFRVKRKSPSKKSKSHSSGRSRKRKSPSTKKKSIRKMRK